MSYAETTPVRRSGGPLWFWLPLVLVLVLGAGFSAAAYMHEPSLTPVEALAVGFGGLAASVVGLFVAAIALVVGFAAAVFGIVIAGSATAFSLFIVASPLLAVIFIFLFFRARRRASACPDPGSHGAHP
ncbi:MAG: hypothetical protein K2Q06_13250 [Parvularculaceae bacterium]|nr:hypothetical protein [Parvularculaceae bacterium]